VIDNVQFILNVPQNFSQLDTSLFMRRVNVSNLLEHIQVPTTTHPHVRPETRAKGLISLPLSLSSQCRTVHPASLISPPTWLVCEGEGERERERHTIPTPVVESVETDGPALSDGGGAAQRRFVLPCV
jgi:hypothetical protein